MKPVRRKGTIRLLKLLKGIEGTPEHEELLTYIGHLEESEKRLFDELRFLFNKIDTFDVKFEDDRFNN